MGTTSKITGTLATAISKVSGVAISGLANIMGQVISLFTWADDNSLEFDGSNDYIETDFTFTNENITYSFWVKRGSTAHGKAMIGSKTALFAGLVFRTHSDNGYGWFFGEDAGGDYWGSNTGDIGFSNGSGWHHIVMTLTVGATGAGSYHNATAIGYMDGVKVVGPYGTGAGTNPKVGSSVPLQLCIGGSPSIREYEGVGAASYFPGNIDDVAFWDTVLTPAEITAIYNNGDPIDLRSDSGNYASSADLAYYSVMGDGDTYSTITDRSGNGNDGTMTNMTSGDIVAEVPDSAFTFTMNTENAGSATKTFVLPLVNDGSINFTVDWGDSSSDTITAYNDSETTHVYDSTGTYTIKMIGTIRGWDFANGGDKAKIINISKWGDFNITQQGIFMGCANLTSDATDAPIIGTTDLSQTFNGCAALNGGLHGWDVSSVTSMSDLFFGCTALDDNLSSWDVSSVTNMYQMFSGANSFNNSSLNSWDVSSVTNMSFMFTCTLFNGSIRNWETGAVTNMQRMFGSPSTFNQSIGTWDTANVTNLSYMFYWNTSFNQDIGDWDTGAVTDMTNMLRYTTAFNQDIGDWDIEGVTAFGSFMQGDTLSTANYDALLVGWSAQDAVNEIAIHFGSSTYTGGEEGAGGLAREDLIAVDEWSITDGGAAEGGGD